MKLIPRRIYEQESLRLEVTEAISECMDTEKITKSALAKRAGLSKSRVTQVLRGDGNLTLDTVSDLLACCGYRLVVLPDLLSDCPVPNQVEVNIRYGPL